jgi:hypothetical protein
MSERCLYENLNDFLSMRDLLEEALAKKLSGARKWTTPPSPEIIARVRAEARGLIALTIKEVSNGAWR